MDLRIALGLTVGSVVGTINAIRGIGHVYFDSLAVLVFLLLIGRWIQFRQQQRASPVTAPAAANARAASMLRGLHATGLWHQAALIALTTTLRSFCFVR